MKYLALLVATFAMLSPLFLVGIRKYTGTQAKRALGTNIIAFFGCLVMATVLGFGGSASAAAPVMDTAAQAASGMADGMKYIGSALAVGLSGIGGGIAVSAAASSALGAISENDKNFGKALIFVGLAEGVALYGLIVALLLLFT
ncbi:MAG: ATP synthase subunit C [Oscillospiraceae bacterium]|nr:ATP synthase subunit C [Oscillospiraceae bacterium]MCD7947076.1 ATP synthase subunit C [Oscillospiraceae bacterium]